MNKDNENNVLKNSRDALNDSIEHLDANTLSRLNQARQKSLSQKENSPLINIPWIPAGALAALSITVVVGSLFLSSPESSLTNLDEAEFMATNEEIELVEDLEFVAWLIEQENAS
jgi:hypothetical protein